MQLSNPVACICEGAAENAIMDILLDNDLLVFKRTDMLDDKVIRTRSGEIFEKRYLRKSYRNRISIIRILDSRREEFRISRAYIPLVDVINIITAPEIEMLIIHSEQVCESFKKSRLKPSEYCVSKLHITNVKSYDFVRDYFDDTTKLLTSIFRYRQKANIPEGEHTLMDLLNEKALHIMEQTKDF